MRSTGRVVVISMFLLASCYRSHELEPDAGLDSRVPREPGPRYDDTLDCDDPELWRRPGERWGPASSPVECEPFAMPLHQFWLHFGGGEGRRTCLRVTEAAPGSGWEVGQILEVEPGYVRGYVRGGDWPFVRWEVRYQHEDGRLSYGPAEYEPRPGSSIGRALRRMSSRPLAITRTFYADAEGLHYFASPMEHVAVPGLMTAAPIHNSSIVAWVAEPSAGVRVLGLRWRQPGAGHRVMELALAPDPPLHLAVVRNAVIATAGREVLVAQLEWMDELRAVERRFSLTGIPAGVVVTGGLVVAAIDGAVRAWTLEGTPAPVAITDPVVGAVPGDYLRLADGRIGTPEVVDGAVTGWRRIFDVDPTIGDVLRVYSTWVGNEGILWVGTEGFERPPLLGPTSASARALFGGPIVLTGADSNDLPRFVVEDAEGAADVVVYELDPSFEGCD
ncbi:MAG: hypothetical protein KF901_10870 [Myxococcales bacterium]|nr:hypothetical protein [Myxococcales bacterium]